MKKSFLVIAGIVALLAAGHFHSETAQARPNYNMAFQATYDFAAAKEAKCNVCHMGTEKKMRNPYGVAVGKALGEAKVTDAAKIKAAFETANGEKSAVAGKTFGDLIKDGKLPASN